MHVFSAVIRHMSHMKKQNKTKTNKQKKKKKKKKHQEFYHQKIKIFT